MIILLSNDDGVYADGIAALKNSFESSDDVTVIAPLEERSTTGHTLTLDNPLRVSKVAEKEYGVSGYPADCILMALGHFMKDQRPELVVSGINRGANLGQDMFYSGTMACAREAAFHEIPAIATSNCCDLNNSAPRFEESAQIVQKVIQSGVYKYLSQKSIINLNIPNIPLENIKGIKYTRPGFKYYSEEISHRKDFRGNDYFWIGGQFQGVEQLEGTDGYAVEQGYVAATVLKHGPGNSDKEVDWSQLFSEISIR